MTSRRRVDAFDRGLARLRVLGAAVLVVIIVAARPEHDTGRGRRVGEVFAILFAALLVNLFTERVASKRSATGQLIAACVPIVADIGLATASLHVTHAAIDGPAALIMLIPLVEAGVRFRVVGAVAAWAIVATVLVGGDLVTAMNGDTAHASRVLAPVIVLLLVCLPVAYLTEHLARDLESTARAREDAEIRAGLLTTLVLAGRDLNALEEAQVIAALTAAARHIGAAEASAFVRQRDEWQVLRRDGERTGATDAPALPPSWHNTRAELVDADAGARALVRIAIDIEPNPIALVVAVDEARAAVVAEGVEVLAAYARVALANARLHDELEAQARDLHWKSHHDAMTGLLNRAGFMEQLLDACAHHDAVTVMYADLDGFKPVNDEFGHDAGDAVLVAVARRLEAIFDGRGHAARLGGDEFVLLLTGQTWPDDGPTAGQQLATLMEQPIPIGPQSVRVGASCGWAHVERGHEMGPDDILKQADAAMYRVKANRPRRSRSRVDARQ